MRPPIRSSSNQVSTTRGQFHEQAPDHPPSLCRQVPDCMELNVVRRGDHLGIHDLRRHRRRHFRWCFRSRQFTCGWFSRDCDASAAGCRGNLGVSAIASADRIVVSEHSSGWETIKPGSERLEALPQRLYGEVEFDSPAKAWLLDLATAMPDKSLTAFAACVPEYHHTIVFYAHGEPQSTMSICFQCGQVTWDASDDVPPEALIGRLKSVVARAGFRPERDWDAVVRASAPAQRLN